MNLPKNPQHNKNQNMKNQIIHSPRSQGSHSIADELIQLQNLLSYTTVCGPWCRNNMFCRIPGMEKTLPVVEFGKRGQRVSRRNEEREDQMM